MVVKKAFGISLVALVVCATFLLVSEASLRWLTPHGRFIDNRTDLFWLQLHSRRRLPAAEAIDTVLDASLGWRMKPLYKADGVNHNSVGFRGKREYGPVATRPRIIMIGDSYTYGLGVRDEETSSTQLEQLLDAEVVNAGVNGYGTDQSLLMWELEGKKVAPQVVVLGYYVDDFHRNGLAVREWYKPQFVYDPVQQTFELRSPSESVNAVAGRGGQVEALQHWLLPQAIDWLWRRLQLKLGLVDEADLSLKARTSEFILERLKTSVAQSGARLVIAVYGNQYWDAPDHVWIERSVLKSCESIDILCVNVAAAMRDVELANLYGSNGHLSAAGHRFAAEQLAHAIGSIR